MHRLKKSIRCFAQKIVGINGTQVKEINKLREEVNTLKFFLNLFNNIQEVPHTKDPDLRILQLCDVELLKIIDKLCEKHHLTYWLDFGSLLGAIRHKGFIPWDDDTDISMPRNDYETFIDVVINELNNYGITAKEEQGRIGVDYKHLQTGIWVDIFPKDDFFSEKPFEGIKDYIKDKCKKYKITLGDKAFSKDRKWLKEQRTCIIGGDSLAKNHFLYNSPERDWGDICNIITAQELFPLQRVEFDGALLYIPNDYHTYLERIYGDYLTFPSTGILQHNLGRGALSTWARRNGTNMKIVLEELKKINSEIELH